MVTMNHDPKQLRGWAAGLSAGPPSRTIGQKRGSVTRENGSVEGVGELAVRFADLDLLDRLAIHGAHEQFSADVR